MAQAPGQAVSLKLDVKRTRGQPRTGLDGSSPLAQRADSFFAASLYASFVFGHLLHFVIDSPDLHSNVVGDSADVFFRTALNLALIEFVGFAFGLVAAVRRSR